MNYDYPSVDIGLIDKDYILSVHNNSVYNKKIKEYYKRLYEESGILPENHIKKINQLSAYKRKMQQLDDCNKFWCIDVYHISQVKDFVSTSLCKDKFCNNCKKVKQASRISRYIPELEPYKDNLYHIILTVPNVAGEELGQTLIKMRLAFSKMMGYIRLHKFIKGIDFSSNGYQGAIRSLEITFNEDNYHPHYHCAFVFKNLDLTKKNRNDYSIDYTGSREDRLFSDFEILIQKIWYLCYNNIDVTKKNIDNLEQGYSCLIEKFNDDDYAELFKYMTKETDEKNNILTYDNFKTLYYATYCLKQIQGYGCLYKINDSNIDVEVDLEYLSLMGYLRCQDEYHESIRERPFDLLNDNNYKLISRKKIYQYIRQLKKDE